MKIPNPIRKRDLRCSKKTSPELLRAYGDFFLETGLEYDAIGFYQAAGADEKLRELRERLLAEGKVFLFEQASLAIGEPIGADLWNRVAESAFEGGRYQDALAAFRNAGNASRAEECEKRIAPAARAPGEPEATAASESEEGNG